jgi:hypothetical protein
MKCNKKILVVLYSFFFLSTFNNVVRADETDDGEMKHIIGIGARYNVVNLQTGIEGNLKKIAGIGEETEDDKKKKFNGEGYSFGVEGMVNYDLYFNDMIALGVIVKGGWNKVGSYKFDDGTTSGNNNGKKNDEEENKKKCNISSGNLDLIIGPKFNFISEGLSFNDGEQNGLRFALALYGGIGFNFGSPEAGENSQLKDKIEGKMIAVPAMLDVECVLGFGLKFNAGCEMRFVSPVGPKEEKKGNNNNNDNDKKKDLSFSMGVRPYVGFGYDLGSIING